MCTFLLLYQRTETTCGAPGDRDPPRGDLCCNRQLPGGRGGGGKGETLVNLISTLNALICAVTQRHSKHGSVVSDNVCAANSGNCAGASGEVGFWGSGVGRTAALLVAKFKNERLLSIS